MNKREMEKMLKESGFWLKKVGSKHFVWTNGEDEVSISFGHKVSPTTLASFKSKMRKAQKKLAGGTGNPKKKNVLVWAVAAIGLLTVLSAGASQPK